MRVKSICVWEREKKVALMLKDSLYSHFYLLRITLSVINQKSSRTSFTMFFPFLWMSFVRLTDFLQISAHSVNSWPKNENSHYLLTLTMFQTCQTFCCVKCISRYFDCFSCLYLNNESHRVQQLSYKTKKFIHLFNWFLAITYKPLKTELLWATVSYKVVNGCYMLLLKPSTCIIETFLNNHIWQQKFLVENYITHDHSF